MITVCIIFVSAFAIGLLSGLVVTKLQAKKYFNDLTNPIGSIVAYDDHYMYVELNDEESKNKLFNHIQDLYTFKFVDKREKNN